MAAKSKIEWTEASWNPVTGCTKISEGCLNCYAEKMACRLHAMGNVRYRNAFKLTLHPDLFDRPLKWKKSKLIFVNSMSDLFHEGVSETYIKKIFETMERASWHKFQILTKRSERLQKLAPRLPWADNIWMGVTVESQKYIYRIRHLVQVPAVVRFISFEPLLTKVSRVPLRGINWVIVGGESGPSARPLRAIWVRQIRAQCLASKVPFFFKQWGGINKKRNGRLLDGRIWEGMPLSHSSKECSLIAM